MYGYHCPGDMAVHMRKVQAILWSLKCVLQCCILCYLYELNLKVA